MAVSATEIVHAYRHLHRQGLRAVQFSKPARFTLRDRLRHAFRTGTREDFNKQKIENTLELLRGAITHNGIEHKIVKNLLRVWRSQSWEPRRTLKLLTPEEIEIKTTIFDAFNHHIMMLNESMGTCLPAAELRVMPIV